MADEYLGDIDGQPIVGRSIKLTKAGDGLSEALELEDVDLHVGDQVAVLVRGRIGGPGFKPEKGTDARWIRVDNVVAESALIVEDGDIEMILDRHVERVTELRQQKMEQKKGLTRIPFDDTDEIQQAEDGLTPDDLNLPDAFPEGSPRNPHGLRTVGET